VALGHHGDAALLKYIGQDQDAQKGRVDPRRHREVGDAVLHGFPRFQQRLGGVLHPREHALIHRWL
jgi:hypothetical protein